MQDTLLWYTKFGGYLALVLGLVCGTSPTLVKAQDPRSGEDAVAALQETQEEKLHGLEYRFPALGTLVQITAYHHDVEWMEGEFKKAEGRVAELEAILTDYDPASETSQLTTRASSRRCQVSRDLWEVLSASHTWHLRTEGAFDSSMGKLTQLWRKHRRAQRIPSQSQIEAALGSSGWQHVRLFEEEQAVRFDIENLKLDFGAIGKGYIVDEVFEQLQASGIHRCLVNISGNMRAGEAAPNRPGWKIEIAGLSRGGKPLRQIAIRNAAIATSGDLWQFIEIDGQRRSHILDPKTGYGVPGPVAATIVGESATAADAFATAACILPEQRVREIAKQCSLEFLVARQGTDSRTDILESPDFPPGIAAE